MYLSQINKLAESFGLSIEPVFIPEHEPAIRVYKGAKLIFIGTGDAVLDFLASYNRMRVRPDAESSTGETE